MTFEAPESIEAARERIAVLGAEIDSIQNDLQQSTTKDPGSYEWRKRANRARIHKVRELRILKAWLTEREQIQKNEGLFARLDRLEGKIDTILEYLHLLDGSADPLVKWVNAIKDASRD